MNDITITLAEEDVKRLIEALDSHIYWQLSDEEYRKDGFVLEEGSDDEDSVQEIQQCESLAQYLRIALPKGKE